MKALEHGGVKYTNADAWRSAKAMTGGKRGMMATPKEAGEGIVERQDEPDGEEDPDAIREEHGPATHVEVHHDHEMGVHQVHSVHPDGHHHHSDHHEDAAAAHEHARRLAVDDATMGMSTGEDQDGYGENE